MVHGLNKNLFLIDLDQKRKGFRKFISSWLVKSGSGNVLIDPGPSSTIPVLAEALGKMQIQTLEYILLTHIHIDHAGGVGHLLNYFPGTPVLCHPRAIPHLTDPTKLWEGTRRVLGELAGVYGPIKPVPESLLIYEDSIRITDLEINVMQTPGHAPHHLSFQIDNLLFAGEAFGVTVPETDRFYLRPATPPVFKYAVYSRSIRTLMQLDDPVVCFGHYGSHDDLPGLARAAMQQLDLWMEEIVEATDSDDAHTDSAVFERLLKCDPYMKGFTDLPEDIRRREKLFIENSIQGMTDFIKNKKAVEV